MLNSQSTKSLQVRNTESKTTGNTSMKPEDKKEDNHEEKQGETINTHRITRGKGRGGRTAETNRRRRDEGSRKRNKAQLTRDHQNKIGLRLRSKLKHKNLIEGTE